MVKLSILLQNMDPLLNPGEYVFCCLKDQEKTGKDDIAKEHILATFNEKEGLTLVLEKKTADKLELSYDFIAAWITLSVYSPLNSVGLTAAVSQALCDQAICCNIIAGYHHDHLFVKHEQARNAMKILKNLSQHKLGN